MKNRTKQTQQHIKQTEKQTENKHINKNNKKNTEQQQTLYNKQTENKQIYICRTQNIHFVFRNRKQNKTDNITYIKFK